MAFIILLDYTLVKKRKENMTPIAISNYQDYKEIKDGTCFLKGCSAPRLEGKEFCSKEHWSKDLNSRYNGSHDSFQSERYYDAGGRL